MFSAKKKQSKINIGCFKRLKISLKSDFYNHPKTKDELKKQLILISENKTTPFEAANFLLTKR